MDSDAYLAFTIIIIGWAFKPGPGAFIHMARAVSDGRNTALIMAFGTDIGHVLAFIAVYLGVGQFLISYPLLVKALSIAAGLYLGFVGIQGINRRLSQPFKSLPQSDLRFGAVFASGLLFAFINPINIVFYVGILPSYFNLQSMEFNVFVILLITVFLATFAAHVFYISFCDGFRTLVSKEKNQVRIAVLSNVIFILISIALLWKALK